jgi:hypothetical protein
VPGQRQRWGAGRASEALFRVGWGLGVVEGVMGATAGSEGFGSVPTKGGRQPPGRGDWLFPELGIFLGELFRIQKQNQEREAKKKRESREDRKYQSG